MAIENSSIKDTLFLCNKDGIITYITPNIENIIGFKKDYFIGKKVAELIHSNHKTDIENSLIRITTGMKDDPQEYRFKNSRGTYTKLQLNAYPVMINNELKEIVLVVARQEKRSDLTSKKHILN